MDVNNNISVDPKMVRIMFQEEIEETHKMFEAYVNKEHPATTIIANGYSASSIIAGINLAYQKLFGAYEKYNQDCEGLASFASKHIVEIMKYGDGNDD